MDESLKESIKEKIRLLPEKPGIYKFFSSGGELIYVGKAKSIKKRVSSYFNKISGLDNKTKRLVSQVNDLEFTIVNSEFDAYLLENNLIKENKPKFNILLKDDKTYPYLYVSRERFPRLISTRSLDKSLGTFYGPYTSVKAMNTVLDLVRKLFGIRTCNYLLSEKNIEERKFKVCLEYHIGNCKGPCEALISETEYNQNIEQIQQILKGNLGIVKQHFKEQMNKAAQNLEFEKAQLNKDKYNLLDKFQAGSVVVNPNISDLDVITVASEKENSVINFLSVCNGIILKTKTLFVKKKLDESDEEILLHGLFALRDEFESINKEVITNISIEKKFENSINITQPKIGDKKKLVDLSYKNSLFELKKQIGIEENSQSFQDKLLENLKKDLQLKELPKRIECFDNSNFQGTSPVAAMVCFLNGKPAKKEYRHFNIKTVTGPDDFASMHEIVKRRYTRVIEEQIEKPQLIIIDGGKGQLGAACDALKELNLYGEIPIIGIAKRLEEIYYPEDQFPLYLDKKSTSLKLIQYIRDETHRFAITFHRKKRSLNTFTSELTEIPGIGEKTFKKLIDRFKTISAIKGAEQQEIIEVLGEKKGKELYRYFHETPQSEQQ
jgi:excinuclease ABC subunit C